jgi:hypothetical protein
MLPSSGRRARLRRGELAEQDTHDPKSCRRDRAEGSHFRGCGYGPIRFVLAMDHDREG